MRTVKNPYMLLVSQGSQTTDLIIGKTYTELKALKAENNLVAGQMYRITDFVTTTNGRGAFETPVRSAGHPFDLIIVATSVNTFGEEAMAVLHEGDTYFANSNLSAWEIRYSFENDPTKHYWALPDAGNAHIFVYYEDEDGNFGFAICERTPASDVSGYSYGKAWHNSVKDITVFTSTETPSNEDYASFEATDEDNEDIGIEAFFPASNTGGKGVIYYMKDEFGNECPYDFKNIQFKRKWNENAHLWCNDGNETEGAFCYTFSSDGDSTENNFADMSIFGMQYRVYLNSIATVFQEVYFLPNNCFFGAEIYLNVFDKNCANNTVGGGCYLNRFGSMSLLNILNANCSENIFGTTCLQNYIGSYGKKNTFGNNCSGNGMQTNCANNTFGNDCSLNAFGNYCRRINLICDCHNIRLSSDENGLNIADYFEDITVEGYVNSLVLYNTQTASSSNKVQHYRIISSINGGYKFQVERNKSVRTTIMRNSIGQTKTFCEADNAN